MTTWQSGRTFDLNRCWRRQTRLPPRERPPRLVGLGGYQTAWRIGWMNEQLYAGRGAAGSGSIEQGMDMALKKTHPVVFPTTPIEQDVGFIAAGDFTKYVSVETKLLSNSSVANELAFSRDTFLLSASELA